jgi:hypothetical protein
MIVLALSYKSTIREAKHFLPTLTISNEANGMVYEEED